MRSIAPALERYFKGVFPSSSLIALEPLGRGVHGRGFLVRLKTTEGIKSYVIKSVEPKGLGHDYPSDRAGMFLLALENYSKLPKHIRAIDVLSLKKTGEISSIGGGIEYFLLMERAEGRDYFYDLEAMSKKKRLSPEDKKKISLMADYLSKIHSVKKPSKTLYLRKLRDIIGHGECLMGVFDTYPKGVISYKEMANIEKLSIDWRARLKDRWQRLCQIHGDFHPGNIWWKDKDFILLDRSRGEWGDAADDLTALSINYIFFSIKYYDSIRGIYSEALRFFFDEYIKRTNDKEVLEVLAPFFAFRGAVVANPRFYPELTNAKRRLIFKFIEGVLRAERFIPEMADRY